MIPIEEGSIGIVPAGALGASFFYYLTHRLQHVEGSVRFLERPGSSSGAALRDSGRLTFLDSDGGHRIEAPALFQASWGAGEGGRPIPELLLLCPNPDQLLSLLTPCIEHLEQAHQEGVLNADRLPLPLLVLCSNGIYFQRVRQVFLEKLEEATLLGRLPDLWPDLMPRIIGRLMRGVTIQTGIREGSGASAVYRPGPPGVTRLAGGDAVGRQRAHQLATQRGVRFEVAPANCSPTRVEFDKAMINLCANLLGQLAAINDSGGFRPIPIGTVVERIGAMGIRELGERVVAVGKAVRAYAKEERVEDILEPVFASLRENAGHVPSSIQWLQLKLERKERVVGMTPTELWLLDPLLHYARSANLQECVSYFEDLKQRLQWRLEHAHLES